VTPTSAIGDSSFESARRAAESLVLFRGILEDRIGCALVELLDALGAPAKAPGEVRAAYGRAFTLLAEEAELDRAAMPGDAWQAHLLRRLLQDENPFSQKAQAAPLVAMGPALLDQARRDLRALHTLYLLSAHAVATEAARHCGEAVPFPSWDALRPLGAAEAPSVVMALRESVDWSECADALAAHYSCSGVGIFSRFVAFRWVRRDGTGYLEGVADPDPVQLADLVGYETERDLVVRNAERFVAGHPANNSLLYGDRGTGKSSTVKALLNAYAARGLRLVEVPKDTLGDFPRLVSLLRGRRERFLLFVDDFSFEEHETAYKGLKAVLEGGVEARPDNVLLYATSNRRHLVRQHFTDRDSAPDDIHHGDTVEEKLSLSDRFGLRVRFLAPDQARYLAIARALAARRGVQLEAEDLERRALRWAARHGGRSPRTARQFVDHLSGELALP
jgi:uncharacterized protein